MISRRRSLLLAAMLTLGCLGAIHCAWSDAADQVLVVQNANSPTSKAIASDYARRRGIQHIISITCPDSALDPLQETIDFTTYLRHIEKPVREFLDNHAEINFIVLTKGV